jgi:hypothetical protein
MKLVWTTDAWATVNEAGMGEGPNLWHWKDDVGGGFDRWEIQLDLPGPAERFEYAVLFRHGPAAPAKAYDFWDSNGGMNHVVVNGAYVLPFTP